MSVRQVRQQDEIAMLADVISDMTDDLGLCGRHTLDGGTIVYIPVSLWA